MDIYKRERRLSSAEAAVKQSRLPEKDKALIFRFEDHLFSNGRSYSRVEKCLRVLRISAEELGSLQATKEEILQYIARINRSDRRSWTKRDYSIILRQFYTWLGMKDLFEDIRPIRGKSKVPQLLTQDDINVMVERSQHPRDRAMIAGMYDLGGRVGEWFSNLCIGAFSFDYDVEEQLIEVSPGLFHIQRVTTRICYVSVSGKTGSRTVQLRDSAAIIEEWISQHPTRQHPKSYMWVDDKGRPIFNSYEQIIEHVRKLAANAGIKIHVTFQSFRHGRMTAINDALTETYLKKRHGTTQLKTYIH